MNFFERQSQLSRTLFEINMQTMSEIVKAQQEDLRKYLEVNADFSRKLPNVQDVSTFVELQREYGETVWENFKSSSETQANILRSALAEAGQAVRGTFSENVEDIKEGVEELKESATELKESAA
ncbi:MAG: phasin family protein [Pseudomonadota bacterium]